MLVSVVFIDRRAQIRIIWLPMRGPLLSVALLSLFAGSASLPAQVPSLAIHFDQPTAKVSPMLYGLMTEEINFSYDGGLYAELVRDRTIAPGRRPLFHWTQVARGNSMVNISVDEQAGPRDRKSTRLNSSHLGISYA